MPRFTIKDLLIATALITVGVGAEAGCGKDAAKPVGRTVPPIVADTIEAPIGSPAKNVRRIPIPRREHGYKNFESRAITTGEEFKSFLSDITQQPHWSQKSDFLAALNNSTIDFQNEILLFIRTTVGSGSVEISLDEPTIIEADIVFRVIWKMPESGTKDMNYQCFAVAFPKKDAKNARIVTVLVPVPDVSRGRDFTIAPQVIPLSQDSPTK